MSTGILTLACGTPKYFRMAEALVRSIRLRDRRIPIAVATDQPARWRGPTAELISIDPALGRGVEQKLQIDRYSPFDETLFIDSDCLVFRPASGLFDAYRCSAGFGVIGHGVIGPGDSHISIHDLRHFLEVLGIESLPVFNGGIYYFVKNSAARDVFHAAREILSRRDELGLLPFKIAGAADEPIFAAAMRLAGISPLDWDEAGTMGTALDCFGRMGAINILEGHSKFAKLGHWIEPCVIHFNMNAQTSAVYLRECWRLRLGHGFPFSHLLAHTLGHAGAYQERLLRKLGGNHDSNPHR